jgi:cobalamin biosynthetic protein CobC
MLIKDTSTNQNELEHGGGIAAAAKHWKIPEAEWLDLSTGINPDSWPIPDIPQQLWQRLPDNDEKLLAAARFYYQTSDILAVPGTQSAIQWLPLLREPSRILLPKICYQEHKQNWARGGHEIFSFDNLSSTDTTEQQMLAMIDEHNIGVLVIVNPNNPLGTWMAEKILIACYEKLQQRKGWLIVDEAFMDPQDHSLLQYCPKPGLVVLRSIGKFFGLAGARLGFIGGDPEILQFLKNAIGSWAINHPAQFIATQALQDHHWQQKAKISLKKNAASMFDLLQKNIPSQAVHKIFRSDFFITLLMDKNSSEQYYQQLAKQGILIRHFPIDDSQSLLRFGLLDFSKSEVKQRLAASLKCAQMLPARPQSPVGKD